MSESVTIDLRTRLTHENALLPLKPAAASQPATPAAPAGISIAVHTGLAEVERLWRAFEKEAVCTVFQTFGWLSKWQRHLGERNGILPVIVTGCDASGALLFILPFAVDTKGAIRRLTWLGRELSDYNAPIAAARFLQEAGAAGFAALWPNIVKNIRAAVPARFDLVDLDRMPEDVAGHVNPAAGLSVIDHPSGAHVATLGGDWEKYYAAKRSSSTRKTERKKLRHLAEFGEVRFGSAEAEEERASVMDILIGQKSSWFARMGVTNIFNPAGTREFFMDLAVDKDMHDIVHITQLKVGDVVAATGVGLYYGECCYLVLSSYADAEFTRLGPGRTHLHERLRYAIGKGIRYFDFTVGDEAYKRDWSDREVKLYDYLEPVTLRGHLAVLSLLAFRRLKRFIKQTPILWRAYNTLRLTKARLKGAAKGASAPPGEAE